LVAASHGAGQAKIARTRVRKGRACWNVTWRAQLERLSIFSDSVGFREKYLRTQRRRLAEVSDCAPCAVRRDRYSPDPAAGRPRCLRAREWITRSFSAPIHPLWWRCSSFECPHRAAYRSDVLGPGCGDRGFHRALTRMLGPVDAHAAYLPGFADWQDVDLRHLGGASPYYSPRRRSETRRSPGALGCTPEAQRGA
jgi:hypothetical protein